MLEISIIFFFIAWVYAILHSTGQNNKSQLWEILVPASSKNLEFTYEHHKAWDEYVKSLAGGLTIMRTVKGEWINSDGILYLDRMIPVRIKCKRDDINKIIDFTINHYKQEAVFAYLLSDEILLVHRNE